MANIFGPIDVANYIQQQGELGQQRGERSYLGKLYGQASEAAPQDRAGLFALAAKTGGPEAGMAMENHFGARDDRARVNLAQEASDALKLPAQMRPAWWAARRAAIAGSSPALAQLSAWEWNDAEGLPMLQQVAGGTSNMPTGFQEKHMMAVAAGYEPGTPEYQNAMRVCIGTVGRASSAGFGFSIEEDAYGNPRQQRENPRDGSVEVWVEESRQWVPLGGGGYAPQPQPQRQPVPAMAATDGNGAPSDFNEIPIQVRARAQQLADAGLPFHIANGQLIEGESAGLQPPQPAPVATGGGFPAPGGGGGAPAPDWLVAPRGQPPGLGRGRRKEDQAAAEERAKIETQLDLAPRVAASDAAREAAIADAKAVSERRANAPKTIARYEAALTTAANVTQSIDSALGLIGPMSTGFGGARLRGVEGTPAFNLAAEVETIKANLGFDRLQQMRDNSPTGGALGQVAVQELIALQSTVANLDPNQSEAQLRANLGRVRDHYARWRKAVEDSIAEERALQQAGPQQPAGSDVDALVDRWTR